jgi:hypothetical protein
MNTTETDRDFLRRAPPYEPKPKLVQVWVLPAIYEIIKANPGNLKLWHKDENGTIRIINRPSPQFYPMRYMTMKEREEEAAKERNNV